MSVRLLFEAAVVRVSPAWLRRKWGRKLMESLAAPLDELADNTAAAAKLRFPDPLVPDALARIGAERRIRRGAGESATTYARRLRRWWDDHRRRGGPYALLGQLYFFFRDTLNVRKDLVYHSGTRRWQAGGVITDAPDTLVTRDAITWNADGTIEWAQFWVFFYFTTELVDHLVTEVPDNIVTEALDELVTDGVNLEEEEDDVFLAIPREWSAAHVKRIHVVLLVDDAALVGYPPRLVGEPTKTVGRTAQPIILVHQEAA